MSVLVACEESQAVTIELRKLGIEAFSCDVKPCSGGHPKWHLQEDVIPLLNKPWDMIIAFPPCTNLCSAGAVAFKRKRSEGTQQKSIDFFMKFVNAGCEKIAIENPVGIMSTVYRKPDQIIQPWQFGDSASKRTCLWLKGLSKLIPTKIVDKGEKVYFKSGKPMPKWYCVNKDRSLIRSKTFPGIASAMACQWGLTLIKHIRGDG